MLWRFSRESRSIRTKCELISQTAFRKWAAEEDGRLLEKEDAAMPLYQRAHHPE
jgi:hypothetical protein